jgi:replicative DNA helicase
LSVEKTIIQHLITTEEFGRKVIPFLRTEYFQERTDKVLFDIISDYVKKYSTFPTVQTVAIELSIKDGVEADDFEEAKAFLSEITKEDVNIDWLTDTAESWCKERAVYNAIVEASKIVSDKTGKMSRDGIPKLLEDALAVSFETNIGHDYLEDWEDRFDYYHDDTLRLPFHIEYLNKITGGGIPPKTLSVILAGTGVGKSMFMCDLAAHHLMAGKNVLYITLELSEEMVSERIDANLMDTDLDLIGSISKEAFSGKIGKMKSKTIGKLIVKEYPTMGAGAANFRYLLNELKMKKGFVPDVIYIDYINICQSTRFKGGPSASMGTYNIIKMVAEELRGLAVDYNVPVITATQTNRGGFTSTDLGLEDTAESFGLPATADFMIALSEDEELRLMNQIQAKQLKNRFRDVNKDRKFIMGVTKSKMRFNDIEPSAQRNLDSSGQKEQPKPDRFTPAGKGKPKGGKSSKFERFG